MARSGKGRQGSNSDSNSERSELLLTKARKEPKLEYSKLALKKGRVRSLADWVKLLLRQEMARQQDLQAECSQLPLEKPQ